MHLTDELLERFVGGDLEMQSRIGNYHRRGPIKAVWLEGHTIFFEFDWIAEMQGGTRQPTREWVLHNMSDYSAALMAYTVSKTNDGQLRLKSIITAEVLELFPPDGAKLDPQRVIGLIAA